MKIIQTISGIVSVCSGVLKTAHLKNSSSKIKGPQGSCVYLCEYVCICQQSSQQPTSFVHFYTFFIFSSFFHSFQHIGLRNCDQVNIFIYKICKNFFLKIPFLKLKT